MRLDASLGLQATMKHEKQMMQLAESAMTENENLRAKLRDAESARDALEQRLQAMSLEASDWEAALDGLQVSPPLLKHRQQQICLSACMPCNSPLVLPGDASCEVAALMLLVACLDASGPRPDAPASWVQDQLEMALLNRPLESIVVDCAPRTPPKGGQVSSRMTQIGNPPVAVLPVFHAGNDDFEALRVTTAFEPEHSYASWCSLGPRASLCSLRGRAASTRKSGSTAGSRHPRWSPGGRSSSTGRLCSPEPCSPPLALQPKRPLSEVSSSCFIFACMCPG